jgi:hypothetical protein
MNPNFLATFWLATYPLCVLALFLKCRPPIAVLWSMVIAELLLPPVYQLPISPSWLDRETIPPIAAGLMALVRARPLLKRTRPFRGVEAVFLVGLVVCVMALVTNRDPIKYGPRIVPPQTARDLLGDAARYFIVPWISFYLGRALFKTSRDLREICRILTVSFLAFSLLVLFEVRMSPNLCNWIFGYSPGSFAVTLRWGGYRPTVFFKDGLQLAGYVVTCVITTAAMARIRMRVANVSMTAICFYAFFVLIACKSTGAIGYGLAMVPVVYFMTSKTTYRVAWVVAICFLIYPALRFFDAISVKEIAALFNNVSTDRADSLLYRFDMEEQLMNHVRPRILWGWGDWGRNLLYDLRDGAQQSVPDGGVIIMITSRGMVGFFSYFIPFVYAILRAGKQIKRIRSKADRILLSALALNCSVVLFDLIINSYFAPLHMLLLGALYGLPAAIGAEEAAAREAVSLGDGYGSFQIPVTAQRA